MIRLVLARGLVLALAVGASVATADDFQITPLDETRPTDAEGAASYDLRLGFYLLKARGETEAAEIVVNQARAEFHALGHDEWRAVQVLAIARDQIGDYAGAHALVKTALALAGNDAPMDLKHLAAMIALHQGDLDAAEPAFVAGLAEAMAAGDYPRACLIKSDLVQLPFGRGDLAGADRAFADAIGEAERWSAASHEPWAANCILEMKLRRVWLDAEQHRFAEALATQRVVIDTLDYNVSSQAPILEESLLISIGWKFHEQVSHALALDGVAQSDDSARLALEAILRSKGHVLDEIAHRQRTLRRRMTDSLVAQATALRTLRQQISELALATPPPSAQVEHVKHLAALAKQADEADGQLRHDAGGGPDLDELAKTRPSERLPGVQAVVPRRAALVEIELYQPYVAHARGELQRWAPQRYVAYVLAHTGAPKRVDLGDAREVDAAIVALRRALADPKTDASSPARRLDELVMRKLRAALGDVRDLYLAPSGLLNLVPFDALIDEHGHYLVEGYAVMYLSSGNDLVRLDQMRASKTPPLVMGGAAFGSGSAAMQFDDLPGTLVEANQIAHQLPGANLVAAAAATKASLMNVRGPAILHVATHGFFLSDDDPVANGSRGLHQVSVKPPESKLDPLLLSGLAFAGANVRGADSIATAYEIAGLDLDGTRLVVLSACETGVGDVRTGEGVFGLRRALTIAGAETLVLSLWEIDDDATRRMMGDYYRRLAVGEGRAEALRQVHLSMLSDPRTKHPYYWASFLVSGSPQALDGHAIVPAFTPIRSARGCGCQTSDPYASTTLVGMVLLARRRRRAKRMTGA